MPLLNYQPKVDRDWQYEEVRTEIRRLREVLDNPNLTAEERAIAQSQLANHLNARSEVQRVRRSTRILSRVRLKIVGQSRVGTPQMELTSAVALNCHGCLCLSRHEYPQDSWTTLEVSRLNTGLKSPPVRAKVRFVRLPGNPRELYSVGIELETPANIWGVKSVPEDWLPYLDRSGDAPSHTQGVGPAPEIQTAQADRKAENPSTTPDKQNPPWETKLAEASDIVTPELPSQVKIVEKEAEQAVNIANQEGFLQIANAARDCDAILVPTRVGFLSRLNTELTDAGERLFDWAATFLARTVPQSLSVENGATDIQPVTAGARALSRKLVSGQISVRAGRDVRYWIKIDTSQMLEPVVTGWFRAWGGSTTDIALVLATEHELENLIQGCEAKVLLCTDSIKSGEFHVSIAHSGTYVLALSNRLSIFMPRTFSANIDLHYSTPKREG